MTPTAAAVKERPILCCGPMVRALLDDAKTQTRRLRGLEIVNAHPKTWALDILARASALFRSVRDLDRGLPLTARCPYGAIGDRLWVRETVFDNDNGGEWIYRADGEFDAQFEMVEGDPRWTPSIHCPRRASRILLEITDVRVERLHSISESDALAEGIRWSEAGPRHARIGLSHVDGAECSFPTAVDAYRALWDDINGAGAWNANPWVWVITFRRVLPPPLV
jgi:hypothetical protein